MATIAQLNQALQKAFTAFQQHPDHPQLSQLLSAAGSLYSAHTQASNPLDPTRYPQKITDIFLDRAQDILADRMWPDRAGSTLRVQPSAKEYVQSYEHLMQLLGTSGCSNFLARMTALWNRCTRHGSGDPIMDAVTQLALAHQRFEDQYVREWQLVNPTTPEALMLRQPKTMQTFYRTILLCYTNDPVYGPRLKESIDGMYPEVFYLLPCLVLLGILDGTIIEALWPEIFSKEELPGLIKRWKTLTVEQRKAMRERFFEEAFKEHAQEDPNPSERQGEDDAQKLWRELSAIGYRIGRSEFAGICQTIMGHVDQDLALYPAFRAVVKRFRSTYRRGESLQFLARVIANLPAEALQSLIAFDGFQQLCVFENLQREPSQAEISLLACPLVFYRLAQLLRLSLQEPALLEPQKAVYPAT